MKRKVIRAITRLLCASMVFSNMVAMNVYAIEDGGGQEMQVQESIFGNDDTGEAWEEPEEVERESADSDAAPEEPAEPIDSNKEEEGQENRKAEDEAAEIVQEDLEDPDETETVSENTMDEAPEEQAILTRNLSLPQVYASGRFFTVVCYEEYKAAREEMIEYRNAKQNVDQIRGLTAEQEKKKETER